MLMPSIFNNSFDLMDSFYKDPWFFGFDNNEFKNLEKELYGSQAGNVMNTDIRELESGYEMDVELPGFSKEDVSVELKDGYMIINASREIENKEPDSEAENGKVRYIRRERYQGSCRRSFYVGEQYNEDDIKAEFKDGILKISIPNKTADRIEQKKYIAIAG